MMSFILSTVPVNDVVVETTLDSIPVCLCRVSELFERYLPLTILMRFELSFCKLHLSV